MNNQKSLEKILLKEFHSACQQQNNTISPAQAELGIIDGLIARLLSTTDIGVPVEESVRIRYKRMKQHKRNKELDRISKLV